jgi:hypothetical protein
MAMEPPTKRRKLSPSVEPPDLTDDADLDLARARNDQRLKSLFEGIFQKYGKDFSDVGDEIDLRTGEIIVNKGHVLGMQHEDDTGEDPEPDPEGEEESKPVDSGLPDPWREHDERQVEEQTLTGKTVFESLVAGEMDDRPADDEDPDMDDGRSSVDSLLGDAVAVDGDEDDVSSELHDESYPQSVRFPTRIATTKDKAADPLWQVPDIDPKFSTPTAVRVLCKKDPGMRKPRSASPPNAGSLWAIRTPGRPRSTNPKKKSSSAVSSQRKGKRKQPVIRDWDFARIQHDGSDSDDPLQQDAPSSVSKSIPTIRSQGQTSITPSPAKSISKHDRTQMFVNSQPTADQLDRDHGGSKMIMLSVPDTPEPDESSSQTQEDTPTLKTGHRYEGSRFPDGEGSQVIFTPDEVKLIVQLRSEFTDSTLDEIVQHLPGRTVTDLHEWDKLQTTYEGQIDADSIWSKDELETLEEFTDKSGLWWKDIQTALPARSQKEIENQMTLLWAREEVHNVDRQSSSPATDADSNLLNTSNRPARTPYSDEDDPALRTGEVMSSKQLEELLDEDFDDMSAASTISSIQIEGRRRKSSCASQRGSPRKISASPRKSAWW